MKKTLFLSAICLMVFSSASAQDKKYPKPQKDNVVYLYDKDKNSTTELETPKMTTDRRHVGIWGNESVMVIPGVSSNVRISKMTNPQFLIHFNPENANPGAECMLNYCEVKGQREYVDSKSGAHGTAKQAGTEINFAKVGSGLYLLTLPIAANTGEYFFLITSTNEAFAFGLER